MMVGWYVAVCAIALLICAMYAFVRKGQEHDEIVLGLHEEFGKIEDEYQSKLRDLDAMHQKARDEISALTDQYGKIIKDIVRPIEFLDSLPVERMNVENHERFSYYRPTNAELVYRVDEEVQLNVEIKEARMIEYGFSCAVHVPDSSAVTRSQWLGVIHASVIAHGARLFAEAVGREAGLAI